jgi:SAM-dependent methyltransferase
MTRPQAVRIARAFLPPHPLGNRYDDDCTRAKLRTDPLYPGVLAALRGTDAPLLDLDLDLDLGCGLGLLAHALRADGQRQCYHGVDIDAAKIRRALHIAARSELHETRFDVIDLGQTWPEHRGSVAILDVLQYLDAAMQARLIGSVAKMLTPGAKLVIRSGLSDASGRSRASRVTDVLAHLAGWMQEMPKCYPTRSSLQRQLDDAGLRATFAPLYGNTPFNYWLIVAEPH